MVTREARTLTRDVEVAAIPYGDRITLAAGHQRLHHPGARRLVHRDDRPRLPGAHRGQGRRRDRRDADARRSPPRTPPGRSTQELAWEQLKTCFDPEIPVNIVDLGLVYKCETEPVEGGEQVKVEFTLTAPGCGMGDFLRQDVQQKLAGAAGSQGGRRAGGARPAVGPEHDVRRRAPSAGADVAMKLSSQEEYGLRCLLQLARARRRGEPHDRRDERARGHLVPERGQDHAHPAPRRPRAQHARQGRRLQPGAARAHEVARRSTCWRPSAAACSTRGFCDRHAGVEAHCLNTRDCSIRPVLRGLQDAVDQVLGELTLASLLASESEVAGTLGPRVIRLQVARRA